MMELAEPGYRAPHRRPSTMRTLEMEYSMLRTNQMACLLDPQGADSFALKAAQLCEAQGVRAAYAPGSRGDFMQALQQLGAEPKIHRLHRHPRTGRIMPVHVSCSRDVWLEIFGEPQCVEKMAAAGSRNVLYRWRYDCSDGSVICMGDLFERSPGVHWIVVMRVTLDG
jgi:hypothetical protein